MDGYEKVRQACREGIIEAGCDPIMVNEDFPSLNYSPRTACLDAVASSDIHVVVIGARGGWIAPSGKLVVEEEYDEAARRKLPIIVFLEECARDEAAERFVSKLSNYVGGHFRKTFRIGPELQRLVTEALRPMATEHGGEQAGWNTLLEDALVRKPESNEARLRVVVAPERNEEVIDPISFGSETLYDRLNEIGHRSNGRILAYTEPKNNRNDRNWMIISQGSSHYHGASTAEIRLEERGLLVVDRDITGPLIRDRSNPLAHSIQDGFVVDLATIEAALGNVMHFCHHLWSDLDPFERHSRFYYAISLLNLGHRQIIRDPKPRSSVSMSMRTDNPLIIFPRPRLLSRTDLKAPESEIARAMALVMRRAEER